MYNLFLPFPPLWILNYVFRILHWGNQMQEFLSFWSRISGIHFYADSNLDIYHTPQFPVSPKYLRTCFDLILHITRFTSILILLLHNLLVYTFSLTYFQIFFGKTAFTDGIDTLLSELRRLHTYRGINFAVSHSYPLRLHAVLQKLTAATWFCMDKSPQNKWGNII